MAGRYIHVPSTTEPGGLTAKELLNAHMPCYFGNRDCTTSRFSQIAPRTSLTFPVCLWGAAPGSLPDSCTLCWDALGIESSYRRLPCGHIFHLPCIDHWLQYQDASCPYCRRTFYHFRRPRLIYTLETRHFPDRRTSVLTLLRNLRLWLARKLLGNIWVNFNGRFYVWGVREWSFTRANGLWWYLGTAVSPLTLLFLVSSSRSILLAAQLYRNNHLRHIFSKALVCRPYIVFRC